ncbi:MULTISPECIES: tripartite tricarboxylate transporter substrate binding protein [unclassified Achromobacter]|uniref:Bug family tripartite tricarboxylate transporter substrate binding protein n=1 Tax=unclassified Achromobacter TaxID=2626865 RepID=UPI000B518F0D|nr:MULTISPECIES: tripartite tricarboxylate transporter substrate binding protein [unclassified Achromobacter]OWT80996.1 ABC transporter substrate-binding protein [Achromobacter sp. HZ34]OWT81512.1 ABC transporter substrate-binding protein [Achromobacter sp. HZ28]
MFKRIFAVGVLALAACGSASADGPVRLIVAFPPGGPVDLVGRVLAEQLTRELHQSVIVENKPGANGNIGAAYVAKGPRDGSVLFLTSVGAVSISPALYQSLPYDPVKDFAPVSRVVNNATVLVVNPANPATDAADFVARSKTASQPVAIGSSGVGSIPHLALEMFTDASKANLLHVPYKGAAPVINDLMGNQVAGFFGDVPGLIAHIQGGKLKALGVAAPARLAVLPNVKTLAEQGVPNVESNNWYGLLAPAGTPPEIVNKLNAAVRAALANPEANKKLQGFGAEPAPTSPQELADLIASDRKKWTDLIQRKNIKVD